MSKYDNIVFICKMTNVESLKNLYNQHLNYVLETFKELEVGNDPGLLYKFKNRDFKEMIDYQVALKSHNNLFERISFDKPDVELLSDLFNELKKIQEVFKKKWDLTFSMEDEGQTKIEWKELLSEYRMNFLETVIDQYLNNYPEIQSKENAVTSKKIKLGPKRQQEFAYHILVMIESGVIEPPFKRDSKGNKIVHYSELTRQLSKLFEISSSERNFAYFLNPDKNTLSKETKDKIDKIFKS